uniref:Uncharacterized protein n=1 Tax=Schistocephalus solidus TaxID=70667 RepID=A0A0X3PI04_SCHSO
MSINEIASLGQQLKSVGVLATAANVRTLVPDEGRRLKHSTIFLRPLFTTDAVRTRKMTNQVEKPAELWLLPSSRKRRISRTALLMLVKADGSINVILTCVCLLRLHTSLYLNF